MKYEPLGFIENGITYHIYATDKMVTVVAKKGDLISIIPAIPLKVLSQKQRKN